MDEHTTFEPIKDYNKTTYRIRHTEKGFECNCHGFNNKLRDYTKGNSIVFGLFFVPDSLQNSKR